MQVSYAIHQAACEALAEAQEPVSARGKRSATPRKRPRRDGAKPEASAAEPEPGDPAKANSASDIRSCTDQALLLTQRRCRMGFVGSVKGTSRLASHGHLCH